jgi:phospholipid/cholesterol/gamma-HCH transport system substrate-binding protein
MEERRLQIRVGLLVLLALALLVGFVFLLGDFSVGKGFEVYAYFGHSGDVASGAAVRISGIRVGKVKEVAFLPSPKVDPKTKRRKYIRLTLWIEERARDLLREDAEAFITARGVLGEKYVGIAPGSPTARRVEPGGEVPGTDPPQVDLIAARLFSFIEDLSELIKRDGHLLRRILQKGGDVMEIVDAILRENRGEVRTLLTRASASMEKISGLLDDARPLVADARGLLRRFRQEVDTGRVGSILDNVQRVTALADREAPRILAKVGGLADKASRLADDGRALVGDLRGVVGGEKGKIGRIVDDVLAIGSRARKVVTLVHGIVSRIARGEGSIGAFLKDDELYDNVREMLRDLKQHPWKVLWKD